MFFRLSIQCRRSARFIIRIFLVHVDALLGYVQKTMDSLMCDEDSLSELISKMLNAHGIDHMHDALVIPLQGEVGEDPVRAFSIVRPYSFPPQEQQAPDCQVVESLQGQSRKFLRR